jgi:hypothetical protein
MVLVKVGWRGLVNVSDRRGMSRVEMNCISAREKCPCAKARFAEG